MDETTRPVTRPSRRTVAIALTAGAIVLVLLFPGSGIDRLPPECYSVLGYVDPCDAWVAWAAAAVVAGLVGLALWTVDRRQ